MKIIEFTPDIVHLPSSLVLSAALCLTTCVAYNAVYNTSVGTRFDLAFGTFLGRGILFVCSMSGLFVLVALSNLIYRYGF